MDSEAEGPHEAEALEDERVGYGNPPKSGRFKKGVSGNPSGRPKGARGFAPLVDEALNEATWVTVNGKRRRLSLREIGAKKMAAQIAQGDHRARAQLIEIERAQGRLDPPNESEAEVMDGNDEAVLDSYVRGLMKHGGSHV